MRIQYHLTNLRWPFAMKIKSKIRLNDINENKMPEGEKTVCRIFGDYDYSTSTCKSFINMMEH